LLPRFGILAVRGALVSKPLRNVAGTGASAVSAAAAADVSALVFGAVLFAVFAILIAEFCREYIMSALFSFDIARAATI
jgi:stage V sporulation protein SpoVS